MSALFADGSESARRELAEGERMTGVVPKLPSPGMVDGNRLALRTADGVVSIPATARRGWSVLERELAGVQVGDLITVRFVAWRATIDGVRYRLARVEVHRAGLGGAGRLDIAGAIGLDRQSRATPNRRDGDPMSTTYDNELRGALFKNDRKTTEKQPDYQGEATIAGTKFRIAGWIRTSHAGRRYLSLRFDVNDPGQGVE
jgi:hypothetical protein